MRSSFVALCLLLVPVVCLAQPKPKPSSPAAPQPSAAPAEYPIRSVKIEGTQNYTEQQVQRVAGLKIGEMGDRKAFEAARDRLVASGAFESVAFRYGPTPDGGYSVVFEVTEIQQIYPMRFEYIKAPEAHIRAWLKQRDPLYTDKVPGTKQWLNRYAEIIEDFLKQQGTPEKITGELTTDRPDEIYIMFRPAGSMPVVAEVTFTGSKVIPEGSLREAIRGVAIGSRYTESRFRQLLDTSIRPLYEARGRVAVSFPKITTEPARGDVKGLKVTVEVNEGETYNLGEVQVEGTASMNKELQQVAALKIGDLANFHEVDQALQRIKTRLHRDGYLKAAARAERRVDEAKRTVDLVLMVDPGPQFKFGSLEVKGLDINGEHEIRRIWGLKGGEPFRGDYPDFFLQQVREQGVFDNLGDTSSKTTLNESDMTVDVILTFKTAPPPKKEPGAPGPP